MGCLPCPGSWLCKTKVSGSKKQVNLLDVLYGVALLDIQSNRLAREGFDEDLHIYLSTIL